MGILDVIRGMQNGPRGPSDARASGGPSTTTMALLALLAYKAWKAHNAGSVTNPQSAPAGTANSSGGLGGLLGGLFGGNAASQGGGLGGLLGGLSGGAIGGGLLGGLLGDGLKGLVGDMHTNGMGTQAQSWVGSGPNQAIDKSDLARSIGSDDLDALTQQTGIPRDQFLSALQTELPEAVNELTPDGRIPSHDEITSRI